MECDYYDIDVCQLKLLEEFPLVLPQNKELTQYDGYINVRERQFRVTIDVPNYPGIEGLQFTPDWELETLLTGSMTTVNELSDKCTSVVEYLTELKQMLEACILNKGKEATNGLINIKNASAQLRSLRCDDLILTHLQSLGFNCVSCLGADLHSVSLTSTDKCGNTHEMSLKISQSYPDSMSSESVLMVINTDLPGAVCEIIQKEPSIPLAYRCFSEQLQNLSLIWKELQLLDSKVWVIDPTHPKKSDMYRRVFIDAPKVMAQITWNPLQPQTKPDILFQGAESEVETFRNTYESHLELWSNSCDILINMCTVLNLSGLPAKQTTADEVNMMQETGECCICMAAELNGMLPSVSCGQCLSCFHSVCLFQWLEMLGKSRIVHNHISGDCPNCEAEIKCPEPNSTNTT